jgi:hypothetical protein
MTGNRWRKIEPRMWGDEKFRSLSPMQPCGQGLWIYLLTGSHTGPIPGLFRAGRAALAEDLEWTQEAFDKAFQEIFALGMVKADWKARVVWIQNAIKCNPPQSPNVVTSWGGEWQLIPECALKGGAYQVLKSCAYECGESFREAFDKALPKPFAKTMPNQEQEQEQWQEAGAGGPEQQSPVLNPRAAVSFSYSKTPADLHPLNYAAKLLEEIRFPQTQTNLRTIAEAVKAVMSEGKTGAEACDFLIGKAKEAQGDGIELNKFWFEDAKWRSNGKRNGKPSLGEIVEREQAILRSRRAAQ